MSWLRRRKPYLVGLLALLFMVLVYGIQFGFISANNALAAPVALAFVVVLLLILLA